MIGWIISIICIIFIILLLVKLNKKQKIDKQELEDYNWQLAEASLKKDDAITKQRNAEQKVQEAQEKLQSLLQKYKEETDKGQEDLDAFFAAQRNTRQEEMDAHFESLYNEKNEALELQMRQQVSKRQEEVNAELIQINSNLESARECQEQVLENTRREVQRFNGLLKPLQKYEMEQQQRLFYTIQVPDEYKDDINFLITTVSQKVQHPDIINKLVWAEYVKPYMDETIKRVGIKDEPGIYKITNIDSGKCYIGKSTNVKKRLQDHFKSSIGIKTIADQAVHHEIWKTGFWNWTIEVIIYCDKDELNDLEKYYIDFFKSQEYGFNRNSGGGG